MSPPPSRRPAKPPSHGAFVVSLDFELRWGLRDHLPVDGGAYRQNLLGVRQAVPSMLELFSRYEIHATWATVGMLMARDRRERERFQPSVLPRYRDPRLSPYGLEETGHCEQDDPLHYASTLVEQIAATPGQEIGTHTFSHYYCQEAGQTATTFSADLESAHHIAKEKGLSVRSLVLPRNQLNPSYIPLLKQHSIKAFRGNPRHWAFDAASQRQAKSKPRRLVRLADAYAPLTGDHLLDWDALEVDTNLFDVAASAFLRPWSRRLARLEPLRLRRLRRAIRRAAIEGRLFHLWWHPHNFGANLEENLDFLEKILVEVRAGRDAHGLRSLSMGEVADVLST